jgi:hypothetical protein
VLKFLVIDLTGQTDTEQAQLSRYEGYELVAVVGLPLCRRAYLKLKVQEQIAESTDDPRLQAIGRIVDKRGAVEYRAMQHAIQAVLASDPAEASSIADQYCDPHYREPTTERPV